MIDRLVSVRGERWPGPVTGNKRIKLGVQLD